MTGRPDWLLQPIAHRGLHDATRGIIENTPSAFEAALRAGYAIETDLRAASCGTPMVFHDASLERLTHGAGPLAGEDAETLGALRLRDSADRMPTLAALLDHVDGRVPLFLEVKSDFTDQSAFAARIVEDLCQYRGPVALMSFDPWLLGAFRELAPQIPRGLGATRVRAGELPQYGALQRVALTHLLFIAAARPHFLSCEHTALGLLGPLLARRAARLPVIAWTIRTPIEATRALRRAGAIFFEGFTP